MEKEELKSALEGKSVIITVGSGLHGDDGVGPLVARMLRDSGVRSVIDGGVSPENETWRIRQLAPDRVLFVDAVDFKGRPGDVALLRSHDLRSAGYDTHRMPLRLTMDYLESELKCSCYLLAVQPRTLSPGAPISDEVCRSAETIARLLREAVSTSGRLHGEEFLGSGER